MAAKPNVPLQDKTVEKHEMPSNQSLEIMYARLRINVYLLIVIKISEMVHRIRRTNRTHSKTKIGKKMMHL